MRCGDTQPHERHRVNESWSKGELVSFDWCRGVWTMPAWMEPYRELITDTGGDSVENLMNDETTAQQNLIRAALALAVRDQVSLLYQLHLKGLLVNGQTKVVVRAEVLERVERYAAELQEGHYDELGAVGQTLVDEVQGLRWIERDPARCEARARKGTGQGACDRPLDKHGQCDRASSHI